MHKSKSVLLLSAFSAEELKRFEEFLKSPYFNKSKRVTKLLTELAKYHPDFSSANIKKNILFKKLFPGKVYNDQVMKNLNSEFLKLEKEFLAYEKFSSNPLDKSLSLISNLTRREVDFFFNKETEITEKSLRDDASPASILYLMLYRIEDEKFSNNILNNNQEQATINITKAGEYLILFFLKNLLRLCINHNTNRFSFNAISEINVMEKFLEYIDIEKLLKYMEQSDIESTISIKLFYFALVSNMKVEEDKAYFAYRKLLFENKNKISREECQLLFHFLESIIAQKINSGRLEFYKELFEIYVYELDNDLYIPNKETPLTVMKFRNIYLSAIRAGNFEWAEKFIIDYKNKLQKKDRQSIVELSLAHLNFEKKDFNQTLSHLQKVRTSQVFYKVDVKNLSLMALYELSHFEAALSMIESFKKMLRSNSSVTGQYREKNINFIVLLNTLIKCKIDNDKNAAEDIKAKLSVQRDPIANKKWLTNKVSEV